MPFLISFICFVVSFYHAVPYLSLYVTHTPVGEDISCSLRAPDIINTVNTPLMQEGCIRIDNVAWRSSRWPGASQRSPVSLSAANNQMWNTQTQSDQGFIKTIDKVRGCSMDEYAYLLTNYRLWLLHFPSVAPLFCHDKNKCTLPTLWLSSKKQPAQTELCKETWILQEESAWIMWWSQNVILLCWTQI